MSRRLWASAVSAGIARGRSGAHILDVEVYACPDCVDARLPDHVGAPPVSDRGPGCQTPSMGGGYRGPADVADASPMSAAARSSGWG